MDSHTTACGEGFGYLQGVSVELVSLASSDGSVSSEKGMRC
jgi:hypothetical protein